MSSQQFLNVLVVDRDEETVLTLKDVLAEDGHRVNTLSEPSAIGSEIRDNRYQIVILDVSPGSGGAEALDAIRRQDNDLCVIATTGIASVEAAVLTMKNHAFHYLQKPLDADEFRAVLKAAIEEKGLLVDLETRLNSVVGARIRELRHSRPLTLKQLANRTGLSVSLISQIELGKSAASMSTLHKLATSLQTRMTHFFETV
ncbi:MAG: response regulator [bacterium]|nr:response regulator [bacterium]